MKANAEAAQLAPAELPGRQVVDVIEPDPAQGQMQNSLENIAANDRAAGVKEREIRKIERDAKVEDELAKRRGVIEKFGRRGERRPFWHDQRGKIMFENPHRTWEAGPGEMEPVYGIAEKEIGRDSQGRRRIFREEEQGWQVKPGMAPAGDARQGQLSRDRELGRELVRADRENFGYDPSGVALVGPADRGVKRNNLDAALEAESIKRGIAQGEVLGTKGFEGQARLNNIITDEQQRRGIPTAFQAADVETKEAMFVDPITGNPVAVNEPATTAIAGSNTPDTAQMLNAPKQGASISWVANNMPEPIHTSNVIGGDDLAQGMINQPTTLFADKLKALPGRLGAGLQGISSNVRNIEEFDKAIDYVIRAGTAEGVPWKRQVRTEQPDGSINVAMEPTRNPGPDEVLTLLRYTPAEKRALAGALFQLEMARQGGAVDPIKDAFFARDPDPRNLEGIRFDAPDAMVNPNPGEGEARFQRIRPNQQIDRKLIVPQLLQLPGPTEVRDPAIALAAGEKNRIWRAAPRNVPTSQMDAHFENQEREWAAKAGKEPNLERGRGRAVKAKLARERHVRDERNRAQEAQVQAEDLAAAKVLFERRMRENREFGDNEPTRSFLRRPF